MTVLIIISVLALLISIAALIVALRNKTVVRTEHTTIVKDAPVSNPFIYDNEAKSYKLDGSLYVTGSVSALGNE